MHMPVPKVSNKLRPGWGWGQVVSAHLYSLVVLEITNWTSLHLGPSLATQSWKSNSKSNTVTGLIWLSIFFVGWITNIYIKNIYSQFSAVFCPHFFLKQYCPFIKRSQKLNIYRCLVLVTCRRPPPCTPSGLAGPSSQSHPWFISCDNFLHYLKLKMIDSILTCRLAGKYHAFPKSTQEHASEEHPPSLKWPLHCLLVVNIKNDHDQWTHLR